MSLRYVDKDLVFSLHPHVPLGALAQRWGTPLYIYDLNSIQTRAKLMREAFQDLPLSLHYAAKANSNGRILALLAELGYGADVVSSGELQHSLDSGVLPQNIIFSGVGKSKEDINLGLEQNILQFNVESIAELKRIIQLAHEKKTQAPVALRINPNIKVTTHPYIQTGFKENKFGIALEQLPESLELLKSEHLEFRGISLHLGSQILDAQVFLAAVHEIKLLKERINHNNLEVKLIDLGGGLGIYYEESDEKRDLQLFENYSQVMHQAYQILETPLALEPGRFLTARAGVLIGEIEYLKFQPHKNFAILNTGTHHLMRPALYQAFHRILPLIDQAGESHLYDVVGPLCESSDTLGKERSLKGLNSGDFLAICDAGAYGMSMASTYNRHALPREIGLLDGQILDLTP